MAREVDAIPDRWKTLGAEYVVDIGDNQRKWRRYVALAKKSLLSSDEIDEQKALEEEVPELFTAHVPPLSHDEYKALEEAETKKMVKVTMDSKRKNADVEIAGLSIGERIAIAACKKIPRISNYVARFYFYEEETGEPILGDDGRPKVERKLLKNGKELVEFITTKAWEDERDVLDDLLKAMRDRSHLAVGEKKTLSELRSSSSPATAR